MPVQRAQDFDSEALICKDSQKLKIEKSSVIVWSIIFIF